MWHDIEKTDKRGVKMAYVDTTYWAPMPVTCRWCGKHMTVGQVRAMEDYADPENGRIWCSERCRRGVR